MPAFHVYDLWHYAVGCYPSSHINAGQPIKRRLSSHREWAEIAGGVHKQGLFWIVADIITQLVPAGRVAVEAHNAICEYLGPEYVGPHLTHCLFHQDIAPPLATLSAITGLASWVTQRLMAACLLLQKGKGQMCVHG